ncbi:MAG: dTDP-4-dehydrorhamnose reductase [Myxococcaceae bacterium]|nr:dTDP-4-dehydrorhamnose reductase [Myxococcaceae bacterium]
MRALVIGGNGMLARELKPALQAAGFEVSSADLPECDITDPASIAATLERTKPDWVFNTAAWTKVDLSEKEVDATYKVNADGAGNVARALKGTKTSLVHISTDYVFDGKKAAPYDETDACDPMGVYAKSKRAGEEQVLLSGARVYVVRTGELYGDGGPSFFEAIFKRAKTGQGLKVVSDQTVAPTWTRELAKQLVVIAQKAPPGVYHATCAGAVTWHDAAVKALALAKLNVPVTPVTTAAYGSATPRPLYSVLAHGGLERLGLYVMRNWDVALAEWIGLRTDL